MNRRNLIVLICAALVVAVILVANRDVFLRAKPQGPVASGVPLPAEFPQSFPLYPGARYLGAKELQGQVDGRWYDRGWFEVRDDGHKVIDWYDTQLSARGYAPVAKLDTPDGKRYGFATQSGTVEMEIFSGSDGKDPTTFSVDFFSTPKPGATP